MVAAEQPGSLAGSGKHVVRLVSSTTWEVVCVATEFLAQREEAQENQNVVCVGYY